MRMLAVLLCAGLVGACATARQGDDVQGDDSGVVPDGGVRIDGAVVQDGSTTDGTLAIDARVIDGAVAIDGSTCTPPIAGGACDTAPQCGCQATQTCSIAAPNFNTTSCVAVGTTATYANCTGDGAGQCMRGATCVDGACQPFCDSNADCPGTAYRICAQVSNATGPVAGFKFCTQQCDPLNPQADTATFDPCGPGVNCFPNADRSSSCVGPTTSSGTQGLFCDAAGGGGDASLCAPSYACIGSGAVITFYDCYKMCRVGMNTDCAGLGGTVTRTCVAFGTKQYAGLTEIGYCRQSSGSP